LTGGCSSKFQGSAQVFFVHLESFANVRGGGDGGVVMRLIMLKAGSNFASYRNEYLHLPGCKCAANVKAIQCRSARGKQNSDMYLLALFNASDFI